MGFSRQEYCSGLRALLQGIFLIQGLNPCLFHLLHWQVGSLPLTLPGKPHQPCFCILETQGILEFNPLFPLLSSYKDV